MSTFHLNSKLRSHLSSGNATLALHHFLLISQRHKITPDKFTIPSLLKLCLHLNHPLRHTQLLHAFSLKTGFLHNDLFVATGLVESYFNHGVTVSAHELFVEMPKRDVVLYTAIICGFLNNGLRNVALDLFYQMRKEGIELTPKTTATVLSMAVQSRNLELGRILHGFCIRKGFFKKPDVVLRTCLMDVYGKCGNLGYARKVFDEIPERNLVTWNSILNAFASHGSVEHALKLFQEMILQGWLNPRASTFACILNVCGVTTDLRKGRELHAYIIKSMDLLNYTELDKILLSNALIDMYFKTGEYDPAQIIFRKMQKKNVVTWTVMISGYGSHGFSTKALETFYEMIDCEIKPDGVAFVAVLTACSHGGLVKEGKDIFDSMEKVFSVSPEMLHYVCMVDMYGRKGMFDEAYGLIKNMPFEPCEKIWTSLLSSCRSYKNIELGEYAAKMALEIDKFDVGVHVLLSRLYAESGRLKEFSRVRLAMQELGLRPITAFSWVEMKNKVYKFTVSDQLNESSKEMYEFLDNLSLKMAKAGIQRDVSNVAHDFGRTEKISELCGHTEKLALAFVLVKFGSVKRLRIGKNLRVCRDCHEVFKYVSLVYEKEIVLKDPNRYHRFTGGECTCNDFW